MLYMSATEPRVIRGPTIRVKIGLDPLTEQRFKLGGIARFFVEELPPAAEAVGLEQHI